jgi:poly(3-hydroxybutyrate) depolymerase
VAIVKKRALGIVLFLLLGVIASACTPSKAKGRDESLVLGSGAVAVHVPVQHTRVGVVVLHSLYNSAKEMVAQGWSTSSDLHRFVAIYPTRGASWNAGLCCGSAVLSDRDDVTWLTSVIAMARLKYGLNTIYLAGNSNGGMMVERLIAEQPWLSGSIAVWGAAPEMPVPGNWSGTASIYDGVKDRTVPYAGGKVTIAGVLVTIRPAMATRNWLVGAHLKGIVVPGEGHVPARNWPELAWQSFTGAHKAV